ncbi:cutinase family protein [Streptomyces sp. NPDC088350]|uniref:cutinase family protein n=1 Tax=Streptomyces sp. NPDC088350 TaxID=3365854 RepID=UPI003805F163
MPPSDAAPPSDSAHRPGRHRRTGARRARWAAATVAAAGLTVGGTLYAQAATVTAAAASCSDVDVSFARGTGELPGVGIVGSPFTKAVASDLPGRTVTVYAVDYAADYAQSSAGAGATDMSKHITSLAARCPDTLFVIGGYSQGASVTDIATGMKTGLGSGTAIPASLAPRVAAVVTFGNPVHLTGRSIESGSPAYAPKWDDFCASGDPVCGGGANGAAHIAYLSNGDTEAGAQFAAEHVLALKN